MRASNRTNRAAVPCVVGTGFIALDVVVAGDRYKPVHFRAGGTCGNVLAILSYLGWQSFPIARLNGDLASQCVLEDLRSWGVRLEFATSAPSAATPIVVQRICHASSGEVSHHFTWNCPNCGAGLPRYKAVLASAANEITPVLPVTSVFFFDRVSRGTLILADAAAKGGALVVFEPSGIGDRSLFDEALRLAHIVKYSSDRLAEIREPRSTEVPLLEIQTLGREGLRYRGAISQSRPEAWRRLPSVDVDTVRDAAGSGDWCTAGLIDAVGKGGLQSFLSASKEDLERAIRFGQALAAWNCGFEGARGGMYAVTKAQLRSHVSRLVAGRMVSSKSFGQSAAAPAEMHRICPSCDVAGEAQNGPRHRSKSA